MATARDGVGALPLIHATQPQLLVLDIKMSMVIVFGLLDDVRDMNTPVQIIVLSTYPDDILKQYALEKGVFAFVSKDNPQLFLDTLQSVIHGYNS